MSRRHRAEKRPVLPDPKFKDAVVSKFMSCLMYDGKRSVAEKIVYGAFDKIDQSLAMSRSRYSMTPSRMFVLILRFVRAVLVVPHIRCRLKCGPSGRRRLRSVG